jgi:hypothetical protein
LRGDAVFFAGFLVDFLTALPGGMANGWVVVDLGVSPNTDFKGHILNTGHFRQPTAMAIGQMVMVDTSTRN